MSPLMVWTVIVFVPLALGAALRALLRRWRRAWCFLRFWRCSRSWPGWLPCIPRFRAVNSTACELFKPWP